MLSIWGGVRPPQLARKPANPAVAGNKPTRTRQTGTWWPGARWVPGHAPGHARLTNLTTPADL
jgi:hypothetical protein